MEKLVVDSGIAVKWFASEEDSAQALLIYDEFERENVELLAPDLIYAEYGNIIWKKQIFQGLEQADAKIAIREIKKVSFVITPTILLFDEALQIAVKYKRTFYDSLYLALSVKENCEFVTADEKFYNAVRQDFPKMTLLVNWR
ncbi:MAG: type II toxin-antitoxin system VapC family toxin [Pyrinomonadaceae bacterium]